MAQKQKLEALNAKLETTNQALVDLIAEKKQLVSLLAHDLRTPLSWIRMNLSALKHGKIAEIDLSKSVSDMDQAADQIDSLVREIIQVEHYEEQSAGGDRQPVDLRTLTQSVIEEHQPIAQYNFVRIESTLPEDPCIVHGFGQSLKRVVANLLSNAIKLSPPQAAIFVTLHKNLDNFMLTVRDAGPGIPLEEQSQIFQKYFRTNRKRQVDSKRSMGIGLYLTKQYVEQNGGTISVESQPNQGAVFTVTIPTEKG